MMALPVNISTIDVRMKYVTIDGSNATGYVTFTPATTLTDPATGTIILSSTITASLSNGTALATLPVTDDSDANPVGFTYQVVEYVQGGRTFNISLPSSLLPSVNLADIAPTITTVGSNPYATVAQYTSLDSRITTLQGTATTLATYSASAATASTAASTASAAASLASISVAASYMHPFVLMGV
jgi:hypothetical protein